MKTIIHKGHAGIWSISKEQPQRKFRLNLQGHEKSAEIFIQLVKDENEAKEVVADRLKIK